MGKCMSLKSQLERGHGYGGGYRLGAISRLSEQFMHSWLETDYMDLLDPFPPRKMKV